MSRTASRELEPLVNNFEYLSEKRRASEAFEKLKKIASMVKPLMRQRNWRVGTLAEFYPAESNLLGLNINQGQKVCLRLRYAGDDTQFMPIENVVDTMLHELAHNVHGPHDQHFHALWDKLRDEHEALLRKGYTGEGFLGKGQRLGGRATPMSEVRRQARAAAERRRTLNAGSGQRLGGLGIRRGADARTVIADAIEKRLKIERGCASNTDKGRQVAREEEVKKDKVTRTTVDHEDEADEALMQAYIEMIQEDEQQALGKDYIRPTQSNPAGARGLNSGAPASPSSLLRQQREIEQGLQASRSGIATPQETFTPPPGPPPKKRKPSPPHEPAPSTWTCDICTLINPLSFLTCDACGTERPGIYNTGSTPSPPLRPTTNGSSHPQFQTSKSHDAAPHNALKPRLNVADNLRKFEQQSAYKQNLPIGWRCSCGNFMEQEWWTCASCGRMKPSS
jgi:DNA-dependent metalloprotease WSS1